MSVHKYELNNKAQNVLNECDKYLDFMIKYNKPPDHLVLTVKDFNILSGAISAVAKSKKIVFGISDFVYRNCKFESQ